MEISLFLKIILIKKNLSENFEFTYENIIKLLLIIIKNMNTIDDKDEIE